MNIYLALSLFSLMILVYWVISELFAMLFRFTGLPDEKARFQVISLLTGCGFTTHESELLGAVHEDDFRLVTQPLLCKVNYPETTAGKGHQLRGIENHFLNSLALILGEFFRQCRCVSRIETSAKLDNQGRAVQSDNKIIIHIVTYCLSYLNSASISGSSDTSISWSSVSGSAYRSLYSVR